ADAVVAVNGGTHTTPFILSGSTLTGTDNTFQGPVTWSGGTISGAASTTFTNNVAITGANPKTVFGGRVVNLEGITTWSGNTAANNNAIQFWNGGTINNFGTFNDSNPFNSFIEHVVGGPHNFNNLGTYNKTANTTTTVDLGVVFNNSGIVNLNAGVMDFVSGTQGPTGTIQVASGATFQQEAASTVGNMITAGTLALSNRNLTVFIDYNNANFGVGNSFNPRANVTGTGLILAAPNVAQVVTGMGVTNGGTTTPTLTIGNVHVGANTFNYQIANTGTTGPALRGALQTAVNSGNITDARLSGSGVTASNFGPVATGANTGNLGVTFTAASAGALAPLSGQVVHIINNFDNVADQNLSIVLGAGAAAYNLAAASATPNPVNFGNVRVGTATDQALSITNTAPNDGFSEKLNASISTNGAPVTASGSFNLLGPQATDNTSLHVGIDTSSAGAKSGSATIALVSDGTGTSGLGTTSLTSQTVNVSGNVYQVAQGQLNTAPLSFGTVQVGQTVQQTLSISNVATGPAGFVEDLNASFGNSTGTGAGAISGTGSISGLVAGGTNSNTMVVNVNTSGAGTINGAIAVNYFTAGAVSGVSNGLSVASVGSESFGVSGVIQAVGQIVDQAQPVINTAQPINLGNVRIGAASPTAFVSVTNQATGNQQAALNASISGNAPITASGSFNLLAPGATDSTSLQVGMNTGAAGAINGTATIAFVSDASNIGGCTPNCQLNLVSQNVQVTGNVYRLANPTLNTPSVTLAARVGDTAPSASVSVTNTSPDAFTEGLKASFGTTTAGFTPTGSIANLAAGGTDASNLNVALASTATSQNVSGTAQVNFESTGAGTTGATDISVGSTLVNLVGKVYQQAVALVNTAAVNFGIVHVGDVVTAQNVSVTNNAPSAVLNDVLTGSISATGPFTAGGNLGAGLGAGATDASSLMVGLDTSTAGSFNGQATISAQSHNADMADLALGNALVSLSATVNNYAVADLKKTGGAGNFTSSGNIFTLDLGNLVQGTGAVDALLEALNNVAGPSDLLNGSFDLSGSTHFQLTGFNNFADLGAGDAAALEIGFDPTLLGLVSDTITLSAFGHNASGFVGDTQVLTLILKANVVAESVPEPGSLALVGIALLALAIIRRNSARPQ
ncbi:MAG TPA: choice-of-anchor D domain-containing protein, partial [Thiobacillaceae bacterium]|nr:choice-of-anchor D domain-containing protein [Thiobacillaceae bacterium]